MTYTYTCSYSILEKNNYKIELIETYPCLTREELNAREGFHIRNTECINRCIAGRTKQEYYKENQEKILEQKKHYHEDNQDQLKEKMKSYYEKNKKKILEKRKSQYETKKQNKI